MLFEAIVRRFPALKTLSEATVGGRLTGLLSLGTAQVEAEFTEVTRSGRRFMGSFGTTGLVPVTAMPTTLAIAALYNADLNKSYVIDSVTALWLSAATAGPTGLTMAGIVSPITATLPAAAAGSAVGSCSAGGLVSKAILASGAPGYTLPTPTGMTQWGILPGHQSSPGVGDSAGVSNTADVRGRIIVPPGKVLGLTLFAATATTQVFLLFATWHEVELDLE
jgi:hypothetical protein